MEIIIKIYENRTFAYDKLFNHQFLLASACVGFYKIIKWIYLYSKNKNTKNDENNDVITETDDDSFHRNVKKKSKNTSSISIKKISDQYNENGLLLSENKFNQLNDTNRHYGLLNSSIKTIPNSNNTTFLNDEIKRCCGNCCGSLFNN
jgi:hypothetical protein